jgi:hypothetical protein
MKAELEKTIGNWTYVRCEVWVHTGTSLSVSITKQCEACGTTNIRFMHILEHEEDKRVICVGIECAGDLLEDWELPRLAENETKRKERWRIHYGNPGRCFTTYADLEAKGRV